MKLVFVYYAYENQGSELDLQGYARVAKALGHEVTVYGPANPRIPLNYSTNLHGADAVVFVVEWTTGLQNGDRLDWARLIAAVPRRRRIVIDCDGRYNDMINITGDYNHRDKEESRRWVEFCDGLADKIYQPTYHPLRPNVRPFLFHLYDPIWETPLDFSHKEFSMVYVGHSKFRWHGMSRVLRAIEPIRERVGRIALFGHGWAEQPSWAASMGIEEIYRTDPAYLQKLGVEAIPPVPFARVIETMSRGVFNPIVYRPLFEHLGMVTCRTFETPAAGTIPLFVLDPTYVRAIYGDPAAELLLGERPHEKILDVLARPDHYAMVVREIRSEFGVRHSPEARLRELIEIIES
ncbi:MAG: glycosyltransferase [Planctomycetes bacterium]|nr:glycosyltransferase [Planctomycetota bacterium]